jgi:plastocyanin
MNMTGPMPAGGVGGAFPFSNSTATVHLDAGTYAVVCFIPDPAGVPHAMHGMVRKLMVENTTATPAAEPTTSIVLTASDYKFNLSQNLSAGQQTIKFVNNGTHHHEAALVKLAPNATAKDFTDFFAPGNTPTGPPPATALMGAGTQVPGMHEYFSGNLTAGHWAFLCFEQDSATSPPHFVLGMVLEFDIA